MKTLLRLGLLAVALFLAQFALPTAASATDCTGGTPAHTCYWIGGTGTWDNSSTSHWSFTTGGSTCTCLPGTSADLIIFDGSSGGGTVTLNSTLNGATFGTMTLGAFTGTITNVTNNATPITFAGSGGVGGVSLTGAATKTLSLGSATYNLTGKSGTIWDCGTCTNLTLTAGTYNIVIAGTSVTNTRTFTAGGKTYATISLGPETTPTVVPFVQFSSNSATFATLAITGPAYMSFTASTTTTITNAVNWTQASAAAPILVTGGNGSGATISTAGAGTASWGMFGGLTISGGGSIAATNSLKIGPLTGVTVTTPNVSGGGYIIGG